MPVWLCRALLVLFLLAPAHQSSWATPGCLHNDMIKAVCHPHRLVLVCSSSSEHSGGWAPASGRHGKAVCYLHGLVFVDAAHESVGPPLGARIGKT